MGFRLRFSQQNQSSEPNFSREKLMVSWALRGLEMYHLVELLSLIYGD